VGGFVRAVAALLAVCLGAESALAAADALAVRIELDPPTALGSDAGGLVFLSGRALADFPRGAGLDLVLALDTSDSTDEAAYESGAEVRGPQSAFADFLDWLGFGDSAATGPTIFAEELRAARAVIADLDPGTSRVAIVLLAGDPDGGSRAPVVALPLSEDFARATRLLDWLEPRGPEGHADWASGLRAGVSLLVGLDTPRAPELSLRRRALLILTDARLSAAEAGDPALASVLAQAQRAEVRIDALVFGEEAARGAQFAQRLAASAGGRSLPITQAALLPDAPSQLDYARIAGLEVWNDTLAEPARALYRRADGSFGSLVQVAPGENHILVVARSWDGFESRAEILVIRSELATPADLAGLAPATVALRGRLLRTMQERQVPAAVRPRRRDLRVGPEANAARSVPASAAPAD